MNGQRLGAAASVRFAQHVAGACFEDMPTQAIDDAKTFILDTLGVGIAGSTSDKASALADAASRWGAGDEAAVWGTGRRLPAPAAALVNGFQAHCQEFDCNHERAVVHVMTTTLSAALAFAERQGGVSGKAFLTAIVTGVDVSASLGMAAKSRLQFFRPATAGGFGAAAAVGRLAGLGVEDLARLFGVQYSQTSGTMQPHIEGSVVLPMQVGFNARAAIQACDLTLAGIAGPLDTFEGAYGYLRLFEGEWDLAPHLDALGRDWQISRVSHKPYPAGRAGHAAIEGLMRFYQERPFGIHEIERITFVAPPIVNQLCSRPDLPAPTGTYARVCAAFIGAKVLQHGRIGLEHYRGDELTDARTHELAQLFCMTLDGNPDPNALVPQEVVARAKDGREWRWRCDEMMASPSRRFTREQHLAKFRQCCTLAAAPMSPHVVEGLIEAIDNLEAWADIRDWTHLLCP